MSSIKLSTLVMAPMNWCVSNALEFAGSDNYIIISGENLESTRGKVYSIGRLRKVAVRLFNLTGYLLAFDLFCSCLVFMLRPKNVIVWSGSSFLTLKMCSLLNTKSLLYCGSASVWKYQPYSFANSSRTSRFVHRLKEEYKMSSQILTESNWAKSTYVKHSEKIYVRKPKAEIMQGLDGQTPSIDPSYYNIVVPSTLDSKGFSEAIQIASMTSGHIKWHFFGPFRKELDTYHWHGIWHGQTKKRYFLGVLKSADCLVILTHADAGPRALIEAVYFNKIIICSEFCIGPDLLESYSSITVVDIRKDLHNIGSIINELSKA